MNTSVLLHIPFETPALISGWLHQNQFNVNICRLYQNDPLPEVSNFDFLLIMGGPMNVDETDKYPYLTHEKELIRKAVKAGKKVLGICLGAQLIANALGAPVTRNLYKEIGFFPVNKSNVRTGIRWADSLPENFMSFHWHGDTFSIPDNAHHLFQSEACRHQGFLVGENVLALQFHPEISSDAIDQLVENCADELIEGPFIQKAPVLTENKKYLREMKPILDQILSDFLLRS